MKFAFQTISSAVSAAAVAFAVATAMSPSPAAAQGLLNGYWQPVYEEDLAERGDGPDQGEYEGLPVNKAAQSVALTWNPERLTLAEEQCRPHPSIYGPRGIGTMRIWEQRDPLTSAQTQIETWIAWQQQHRHIWVSDAPPTNALAEHTWQGYSLGTWVGDVLHVHTDKLKPAWTRRNGLPTTDQATMDEVYFRYGDVLTHIMMVSDPHYLSEPMVKSNEYELLPNGTMPPYPCESAEEIPRAMGIVPSHLPNQQDVAQEWAATYHIPVQAAMGGVDTQLPEYQDALEHMPQPPSMAELRKREQAAGSP